MGRSDLSAFTWEAGEVPESRSQVGCQLPPPPHPVAGQEVRTPDDLNAQQ